MQQKNITNNILNKNLLLQSLQGFYLFDIYIEFNIFEFFALSKPLFYNISFFLS